MSHEELVSVIKDLAKENKKLTVFKSKLQERFKNKVTELSEVTSEKQVLEEFAQTVFSTTGPVRGGNLQE